MNEWQDVHLDGIASGEELMSGKKTRTTPAPCAQWTLGPRGDLHGSRKKDAVARR
jgi:hypothetical protein